MSQRHGGEAGLDKNMTVVLNLSLNPSFPTGLGFPLLPWSLWASSVLDVLIRGSAVFVKPDSYKVALIARLAVRRSSAQSRWLRIGGLIEPFLGLGFGRLNLRVDILLQKRVKGKLNTPDPLAARISATVTWAYFFLSLMSLSA
jgi:hypothetical protein